MRLELRDVERPVVPRMTDPVVRRLEVPDTRVVLPLYTCGDVRFDANAVLDRAELPERYAVFLLAEERAPRDAMRRSASFRVARPRDAVSDEDLYCSGFAPYFDLNFSGREYAYPPPG